MPESKYKKAPVSEVICGVTFKDGLLNKNNFFLEFAGKISREYPSLTLHTPLLNEELIGYQNNLIGNGLASGPALYRLRSLDTAWLVQIQYNKIYLNWVRDDRSAPGAYPGYTAIFTKFTSLLEEALAAVNGSENDFLSYELSYHDRIRWPDYVNNLSDLGSIVSHDFPYKSSEFDGAGMEIANFAKSLNAKYSELGGFLTLNFLTATEITGKQILKLELSIKGRLEDISFKEWFERSHQKHIELFEKFISQDLLKKWQH